MRCPRCGSDNPDPSRFCGHCGAPAGMGAGGGQGAANLNHPNIWVIHEVGDDDGRPAHSQRAAGLDPFNPIVLGWHAGVLYGVGHDDEAIAVTKEGRRIQGDNPVLTGMLMSVYFKKGMIKEAAESARAYLPVVYNEPRLVEAFDEGFARGGFSEGMKHVAEFQVAHMADAPSRPGDIGNSYAFAGEKDKALEWLEKGLATRDPALEYLGDPVYDGLRSDPRFQDLLRKVGLPTDDKTGR